MILLVNKEGVFVEVDTSPTTTLLSERVERLKSTGFRLATPREQETFYALKRKETALYERGGT